MMEQVREFAKRKIEEHSAIDNYLDDFESKKYKLLSPISLKTMRVPSHRTAKNLFFHFLSETSH